MIKKNKIKKYSEIIIAGAIGDAYGFPVEFYDLEKIINIYGKNGIQLNNIDYWIVSDDTQMTLFCLDIISEEINNDNLENINEKLYDSYQNWFNT